ncbi:pyridoxamine 5'-phosphate oxidase family protein [Actinophytocola sediminis]
MVRVLDQAERERFLAEPHIGVLSVASDDDRPPLTIPIWYAYTPGGNLTFFTGTQGRRARKTRLLERAGKLSFSVQRPEPPYRYVTVECTLVSADRAPALADVVAITSRYLPPEMATGFVETELREPTGTFVLFTARPDRWLTSDFAD